MQDPEVVSPEGVRDTPPVDADGRPSGQIEGVVHTRAVVHGDHRGSLMETVNFDHPFWEEPAVYAYTIPVAPGRIKGWGMHRHQADRYATLSGRLRVILYDGHADSPTFPRFAESSSPTRPRGSCASRLRRGPLRLHPARQLSAKSGNDGLATHWEQVAQRLAGSSSSS
ncbi:MAG TPA: hypothetical protein VFX44_05525 [Solirubrobacterales bacterium]|nr:hypothetical protein [Solirubrobacterales bacterium]